jgi:hypothetical protein
MQVAVYAPAALTATLVIETVAGWPPVGADAAPAATMRIPITLQPDAALHVRLEQVALAQVRAIRIETGDGQILVQYAPHAP